MNRGSIVTTLVDRLGNRSDLENRISYELDLAQQQLENNWPDSVVPWFLEQQLIVQWTIDSNEVSLPADFIRFVDESQIQMLSPDLVQDDGFFSDPDFLTTNGNGEWTPSGGTVTIPGDSYIRFLSALDDDNARGSIPEIQENTTYNLEIKGLAIVPLTGAANIIVSAWGLELGTVIAGESQDLFYSFTTPAGFPSSPYIELKYQDAGGNGEVTVDWVQVYDPTSQVLAGYNKTGYLYYRVPDEFQEAFRHGDLLDNRREYYSLFGTKLHMTIAPTVEGALLFRYYAQQPLMVEDADENKWAKYAPELLIAATGEKMARYIRDEELTTLFREDKVEALGMLIRSNWHRLYSDRDMVVKEAQS